MATAGSDSLATQPSKSGFQSFENAAADAVLAISYNSSGTRCAVASADHKVRIYDSGDQNDQGRAILMDQWRAHDAEILDIQWLPAPFNRHFATTASDNKLKVWREDPSSAPLSGRRFRCIFSQTPANHVSYASFSFHALNHDIHLALFTHDGLLSLLEPSEPDSLSSWREIDQLYPFGKHRRGTEPRFCLSFHQAPTPSPSFLTTSLPPTTLSLATSASTFIKFYRATTSPTDPITQNPGDYTLQEVLELDLETAVINSLAWSPGHLTSWDVIAAGCDDGTVRIVDVTVAADGIGGMLGSRKSGFPSSSMSMSGAAAAGTRAMGREQQQQKQQQQERRASVASSSRAPSGIGAGLAGMTRGIGMEGRRTEGRVEVKHEWRESAALSHARGGPCWKVEWVYDGSAVASTGDDGEVVLWRRGVEGGFLEWSRTGHSS